MLTSIKGNLDNIESTPYTLHPIPYTLYPIPYTQTVASLLYLLLYSNGDIPVIFRNTSRKALTSE